MSDAHSSRRNFLKVTGAAAAGAAVSRAQESAAKSPAQTVINMPFSRLNPRMGIIGTGGRGTELLKNFLGADTQVNAICDGSLGTLPDGGYG